MTLPSSSSPPVQGLLITAAFVIVVLGIQVAAPVLTTVLLAVFIAVVATPPLGWLRRQGAPKWAALFLVVFVLLDIGSLIALVATGAVEGFRDSLPTYQERLVLLMQELGDWLERVGVPNSNEAIPDILDPNLAMALARKFLSNVGGVVADGLLVLLIVVFILLDAPGLPAKLKVAFKTTPETDARLDKVLAAINRYMFIKCLASLATGVLIWLWLWYLGIDFAVLWGLLAFLFNFIPFVGAVLMAIPAVLMALVQTDLQTTLLVALGYLVANVAIGNVLEPKFMGKGLGISTLAIMLSLLFWGWLLGGVGVFLSVPLTMALMIAMDTNAQTRPIAILMGPDLAPGSGAPEATPDRP